MRGGAEPGLLANKDTRPDTGVTRESRQLSHRRVWSQDLAGGLASSENMGEGLSLAATTLRVTDETVADLGGDWWGVGGGAT